MVDKIAKVEIKIDRVETKLEDRIDRVETKIDVIGGYFKYESEVK